MKTFLSLIRLIEPYKTHIILAVILGSLTILSGTALMATSAYLIAMAALQTSIADLQVAIVGVRFFGISRAFFRYLERLASHEVNLKILARFRVLFFKKIESIVPDRLLNYHSGDIQRRMVGDIESLKEFYVRVVAPPLVAIICGFFWLIFLWYWDKNISLVMGLFYIIIGGILPLIINLLQKKPSAKLVEIQGILSQDLTDSVQGLADILIFGRENEYRSRCSKINRKIVQLQTKKAVISAIRSGLSSMLANGGMWCILVLSIPLVMSGKRNGVMMSVIVLGSLASFESVYPLAIISEHISTSLHSARRLFNINKRQIKKYSREMVYPVPSRYQIDIQDISFSYNNNGYQVLKDISLHISKGKKIAIVGPSGAGKSTLLYLLLHFWDIDGGNILIDGRDLNYYRGDDLRKSYSALLQNSSLFAGSLRSNLILSEPDATDEKMWEALRKAYIEEFFKNEAQGLDTWIGEHGLDLSAGQRQRVMLARFFLRDSNMLLLDEPTIHLDPVLERRIMQSILEHAKDRSLLLITQRIVGLEAMDEIIVLDEGKIVERGGMDKLLTKEGLFKKMISIQEQIIK